jgi:hypothetical protein
LLVGCRSHSKTTGSSAQNSSTVAAGTGCGQVGSVKFDKSKFVLHAGLAFGAFHHFIYKPFKARSFTAGSKGRVKALVKAGLAGAFTVHELKVAKSDAESSPTLCKIVAPLDKAGAALSGVVGKLKSGKASGSVLDSVNGDIGSAEQGSSKGGASISDKIPSAFQLATSH